MKCLAPIRDEKGRPRFSCGHCISCRINTTTMWTKRIYDEFQSWGFENSSFVTLTYNDENLPSNGSLVKEELSLFFKRLRKNLDRKLKAYACGEYGDANGRPHYHAIIFGVSPFSKFDRQIIIDSWGKCDPEVMRWKHKGEQWLKGNAIDIVTREDIQYVAKYCQKRLTGKVGEAEYTQQGLIAPYSYKSQGLGLETAKKQLQFMQDNGFVYLKGEAIPIPKYYRDKFGIKGFMSEEKIKANKLSLMKDSITKNTTQMVLNAIHKKYVAKFGSEFFANKSVYSEYERECMSYMLNKEYEQNMHFEKSYKTYKGVR